MKKQTNNKYLIAGICLTLTVVTLLAFWQLLKCDFITYDDPVYVTENPHVKAGLTSQNIVWAFTTNRASNWHPLTWMSHMLDYKLFGLNPAGHHITSLIFHIANTLLLFIFFMQMTGAPWQSAFVAALFALHPFHVQSVAWIAERKDVLSAFFWFLTSLCYLRYVNRPSTCRYLLTFSVFILGLMAKPMLVTLPFVLLLLDYWPLERIQKKNLYYRILEKIPFLALAAVSSIATLFVQRSGGAVVAMYKLPLTMRISNCLIAYVKYVAKMFWPAKLAIFYPHPLNTTPLWQTAMAAIFLLTVTVLVILFARKYKYLLVGWLWFLGTLVPVIGLVQVGEQAMADRYTYVTLIGLFCIVAWAIPDLCAKLKYRKLILTSTAILVLSAMSICTWRNVGYWRDSYTLFKHAADVIKNNHLAHHCLAFVFYSQDKIDQCIAHDYKAIQINSAYSPAYAGLGIAFLRKGRIEQAANYFEQAMQIEPENPEVINNIAWISATYKDTAVYNPHRALKLAKKACEISKYQDATSLDTLAAAYAATGSFNKAVDAAKNALKLARKAQNEELAGKIDQRLELYRKGFAFIESLAQ